MGTITRYTPQKDNVRQTLNRIVGIKSHPFRKTTPKDVTDKKIVMDLSAWDGPKEAEMWSLDSNAILDWVWLPSFMFNPIQPVTGGPIYIYEGVCGMGKSTRLRYDQNKFICRSNDLAAARELAIANGRPDPWLNSYNQSVYNTYNIMVLCRIIAYTPGDVIIDRSLLSPFIYFPLPHVLDSKYYPTLKQMVRSMEFLFFMIDGYLTRCHRTIKFYLALPANEVELLNRLKARRSPFDPPTDDAAWYKYIQMQLDNIRHIRNVLDNGKYKNITYEVPHEDFFLKAGTIYLGPNVQCPAVINAYPNVAYPTVVGSTVINAYPSVMNAFPSVIPPYNVQEYSPLVCDE